MSRYPIIDAQPSPLTIGINKGFDFYNNLIKSMGLPEAMKSDQQLKQAQVAELLLNNQNQAIHNKYAEDIIKTALGLQQAQTQKMNAPAELTSPIGKMIQDYQNIVKRFGENSDQAIQFKNMLQGQIQSDNARNKYYNFRSQPTQALTPYEKQLEINRLHDQGFTTDQIAQILSGNEVTAPNNPELAKKQQEQAESYTMHNYLPAQAQNAAYSARTARPFGEAIVNNFPKVRQYFDPKSSIRIKIDQLKSIISGKTPEGLEDLGEFKQDLDVYQGKVADILKVPADQISRSEFGKAFNLKSWYSNPDYSYRLLTNIVHKVNEAELGNLNGLSEIKQELSRPIEKNPLAINPNQLSQGIKNNPELAKAAGISQKTYKASDGKIYTREELERIARGE